MTSRAYSNHFSDRNIPFGIASSRRHSTPQVVTRIYDTVIFLHDLAMQDVFSEVDGLPRNIFAAENLNSFAALPRSIHIAVRGKTQSIFHESTTGRDVDNNTWEQHAPPEMKHSFERVDNVTMHLPVHIGDFTGT